jgi:hypothetical protein
MTAALKTAIYNSGLNVSGLSSSNFAYDQMFHGKTGTYCTFFGINNPLSWDSGRKYELDYVQFKVYGTSASGVDGIIEALATRFDFGKANLTVTGWTVVTCVRTMTTPRRKTEDVWEADIEFKIETQNAR